MRHKSGLWWEKSWNPITGCTHAGTPGCDNCYARRMAKRLAGRFGYPEKPNEFKPTFHPDKLEEPLRRKKPTVYFVCSMGDLFHEDVDLETIHQVYVTMHKARNHVFLVLTKRAKRMEYFYRYERRNGRLIENVVNIWPGVSVENQDAMWRVEELVKIPGKHWVNFGPLLGPVTIPPELLARLAGVAVEGESGPGARPMHPDWARGIRDQCLEAGIPFSFKQWGLWHPAVWVTGEGDIAALAADRDKSEDVFGDGQYMMAFPNVDTGRLLDGQLHDAWPWDVIGGMEDGEGDSGDSIRVRN